LINASLKNEYGHRRSRASRRWHEYLFIFEEAVVSVERRPSDAEGVYLLPPTTRTVQGVHVAAACIGTFIAAESGVLNGEVATTTWWLAPYFRQRYPLVRLEDGRMLVRSGRVLTAGAALSHMDMALWLIRQASPLLAEATARYLIVDSRPTQSVYAINDHLLHTDPLVHRFERWARDHLAGGFSLEEAARVTGASKRTLARRVNDVLGKSPLSYFQDLRIERAVHLLRTSNDDVERIAAAVGYADGVILRNLLRRKLGRGVRDIRSERR